MDRFESQLKARISAMNRAGEVANELYPKLMEIFKSFSGEKVCKSNGELLKKINDQLPERNIEHSSPTVMYYRNRSDYTVSFTVKACASDGIGSCAYEEITIYICDISNGIVKEDGRWHDPPNARTDYSVEEITRLRKIYQEKKKEADEARSNLYPFGE